MSKESYARGFVKAAADKGVDPYALAKYAKATPMMEYIAGYPAALVGRHTGLSPLFAGADSVGYLAGLVSDADNSQKGLGPSFIPGVNGFRQGNRIKTKVKREPDQIKKDKRHEGARPVAHAVSEHIGPATSMLASIGTGAGIGALANGGKGAGVGALVGGGVGLAATLAGAIAAAVKRRRSKEEQIESDKGSLLKKYLIPGTAAYDYFKRVGRSQGERDEAEEEEKKSKKTDKK